MMMHACIDRKIHIIRFDSLQTLLHVIQRQINKKEDRHKNGNVDRADERKCTRKESDITNFIRQIRPFYAKRIVNSHTWKTYSKTPKHGACERIEHIVDNGIIITTITFNKIDVNRMQMNNKSPHRVDYNPIIIMILVYGIHFSNLCVAARINIANTQ